jgi:hypothetical protein
VGRIPFELAEPGTDPTRQKNPIPKRDIGDALPWIFGLIFLLIVGYLQFGEQIGLRSSRSTDQTPTETPAVAPTAEITPPGDVSRSESLSESETSSKPVEMTPPAPVITGEGSRLVTYNVGETCCWCYKDDRPPGGHDVALCQAHEPEICR